MTIQNKKAKLLLDSLKSISNMHMLIENEEIVFADDIKVTPKEIHTIQAIGNCKQINVTDLGNIFGVTKSAASQLVSKLTRKGFVKKVNSAHSNKERMISLTELGWQAFEVHERFHNDHIDNVISNLGSFSEVEIINALEVIRAIESIVERKIYSLSL